MKCFYTKFEFERMIYVTICFFLTLSINTNCGRKKDDSSTPALNKKYSINFVTSKPHGLFDFLGNIAGDSIHTPILKGLFEESVFNTKENEEKLNDFKEARVPLYTSFKFEDYPDSRYVGNSLYSVYEINSGYAADLNDFRERTSGLLPVHNQAKFFETLTYWETIYTQLIWNPNFEKFLSYRSRLASSAEAWGMEESLDQLLTFYQGYWPANISITISLLPIPIATGVSYAHCLGNFESVEAFLDEKDMLDRYSVVIHELSHSFYSAQPVEFQRDIEKWFSEDTSLNAKYAYKLFDEGLATTIGSGWINEKVLGKTREGSWYGDEYIDQFGRGLYEKFKEYMTEKKALDQDFVKFSIATYEEIFPNAYKDLGNLLHSIHFITDGIVFDPTETMVLWREEFETTDAYRFSPADSEDTLGFINDYSSYNVVIVVSRKKITQLNAYKDMIPGLNELLALAETSTKPLLFGAFNADKRAFLITVADSTEDAKKAFSALKETKTLEDQGMLKEI